MLAYIVELGGAVREGAVRERSEGRHGGCQAPPGRSLCGRDLVMMPRNFSTGQHGNRKPALGAVGIHTHRKDCEVARLGFSKE